MSTGITSWEKVLLCGLSVLIFTVSNPASAQDRAGTDSENAGQLEEVIVTASKVGTQELQETPIAISVVSGDLLEEQGLYNIKDIAIYVPNVAFSRNIAGSILSLRGIGSNGGSDPSVTTQVDGVYIGSSVAFTDYFDVERVEVLRGPQGTLYGRNATGGTLNFISRQPTAEFESKARLTYGNYDTFEGSAYLSGPISGDNLTGSLAVNYRQHDGFFENIAPGGHDVGSADVGGARLQLRWEPSDNIDATTRADYQEVDQYIESYDHLLVPLAAPIPLANSLVGSYRDVALNGDQTLDLKSSGISEDINWQIDDNFSLSSITAWRQHESTAFNDNDATELFLLYFRSTADTEQFSQEFNLKYVDDRLSAVAGLYYYGDDETPGSFVQVPPSPITPPNRAAARGAFPTLETDSYAVFAQGDYEILTNLSFILGARYTSEKKKFDQYFIANSLNPATPGVSLPGFPITFSESRTDEAFTPKIGLNFQASDDVFIYASATKGFKSGGFNGQATSPVGAGFAPEEIWSYELAAKTEWLERRLRLNLTGFYYDYTDLQVRQLLGPGNSVISNAAKAEVKGLELEVSTQPVNDVQVSGYVSYLDAKYDSFPTASIPGGFAPFVPNQNCVGGVCTIDASGNQLSDAPEWSGMVALDYAPYIGDYTLRIHVDYSYRSRRYFDASNILLASQDSYELFNANIGFGPADFESWQIELFANNLANEKYYQTVSGNGAVPGAIVGDPRTYGIRASYKW